MRIGIKSGNGDREKEKERDNRDRIWKGVWGKEKERGRREGKRKRGRGKGERKGKDLKPLDRFKNSKYTDSLITKLEIDMISILLMCSVATQNWNIDWEKLSQGIAVVESRNNPNAYNAKEKALGLHQIRPGVIKDINSHYNTNFVHSDARNPFTSKRLLRMYLTIYGEKYQAKYGRAPTTEILARIWNGGYRNLQHNPSATDGYIAKLRKLIKF